MEDELAFTHKFAKVAYFEFEKDPKGNRFVAVRLVVDCTIEIQEGKPGHSANDVTSLVKAATDLANTRNVPVIFRKVA